MDTRFRQSKWRSRYSKHLALLLTEKEELSVQGPGKQLEKKASILYIGAIKLLASLQGTGIAGAALLPRRKRRHFTSSSRYHERVRKRKRLALARLPSVSHPSDNG